MNPRKIIHVDMDAFYASIEQRDCPELKGKPVIVGGTPARRGVVASASYEARKFGIRSAMSAFKAMKLCPQAIIVPPQFEKYRKTSNAIREIFLETTDLVEPLSLDEAYLDVTTNKKNEPLARSIAIFIRTEIKTRLNLTASAGVGPNKFIAKLASDLKKPDGLVVVSPEKVMGFLENLPVEKLWGVGPATARKLKGLELRTIADIRSCPVPTLQHSLGRFGIFLHQLAHGIDERPVEPNREMKSCASETTFDKDTRDLEFLKRTLGELAEEAAQGIKQESRVAKTITLKVKFHDFTSITRSRTLLAFTHDAKAITKESSSLLEKVLELDSRLIRLIGVSLSNLEDPLISSRQLTLF